MSITNDDLATYYANLLILQYKGKTRAFQTVKLLALTAIVDQLPAQVQSAFDILTAVGVQLDVIAKYAGVNRDGFDFSGPRQLNDADLRTLIGIAIAQNSMGSSLKNIQDFIHTYFNGVIRVFDHQRMDIGYFYDVAIGSNILAEFFIKSGRLPKPTGVQLSSLIYTAGLDAFFGCRTYDVAAFGVAPFNTYDSYSMSAPCLSYDNALAV